MKNSLRFVLAAVSVLCMGAGVSLADDAPRLKAGSTFTVTFPDMPATFYAVWQKKDVKAQMTVFLPFNYEPSRMHPLLVFLSGGDGGDGSNLGVPRSLCDGKDFICVRVLLFKAVAPKSFLMVSSNAKSRRRAEEICDAATAAGAKTTLIVEEVGKHAFPVSAYPAVGDWLRGPAME